MTEYEILNELHLIFDLGWRAANRGRMAHENPFRAGVIEYEAWHGGWRSCTQEARLSDPFREDPE